MTTFPDRPTLKQLKDRIMADMDSHLPGALSRPGKSVLTVLAIVLAGAIHTLYGFGAWIIQQIDPLTANEAWLGKWANHLGVPRKLALAATSTVVFVGDSETLIPSGTQLAYSFTQRTYQTSTEGYPGDSIPVVANEVGEAGNLSNDSVLSLVTPIAGIELEATAKPFSGGAEIETLVAWAKRVAQRLNDRQVIGDVDDYTNWALQSHTDISEARVYPNTPALGEITIRVGVRGDNPFPSEAVLAASQIEMDKIRNAGATVYMVSIIPQDIEIRIVGIDDADIRELITADINSMITRKRTAGSNIYPEEIERIVNTYYAESFTLLSPVKEITLENGSLFSLDAVQWD